MSGAVSLCMCIIWVFCGMGVFFKDVIESFVLCNAWQKLLSARVFVCLPVVLLFAYAADFLYCLQCAFMYWRKDGGSGFKQAYKTACTHPCIYIHSIYMYIHVCVWLHMYEFLVSIAPVG